MALARQLEDVAMEAKMLMYIGLQNSSAEKCDQAAELYRSIGDQAGEGESLQWKGTTLLQEGKHTEAERTFSQAKELLYQSKRYEWVVVCDAAVEFISTVPKNQVPRSMEAHSWDCEMLALEDDGLISYAGQPGSSGGGRLLASPFYEMAVMNDFVMNNRRPGDTWSKETRSYGEYPLRTIGAVLSDNETVTTPAGTFNNCRLIRMETKDTDKTKSEDEKVLRLNQFMLGVREVWYAPGVGMVKLRVETEDRSYTCVLKEYSIQNRTKDYLPLAIGNRWVYGRDDIDAQVFVAENGLQVRYRDEKDIYYLSHYGFVALTEPETEKPMSPR
jgi:hypothetical protein